MINTAPALPLKRCILYGLGAVILFTLISLLLFTEPFKNLGMEDGVVENLGAVSFLAASVVFFVMFLKIRRAGATTQTSESIGAWFWFLALASLFFFIAGEEISWGQRIFGWSTPGWLKDSNVQEETTIHNIEIFNAHTKDHELKPFWQSLITMNRLFSLFWLTWCFAMPLAMALSKETRQIVAWFRVPVPYFLHGCIFLSTYVAAKSFVIILQPDDLIIEQVDEIKECFYAVIFLTVAWSFYQRWKKHHLSAN